MGWGPRAGERRAESVRQVANTNGGRAPLRLLVFNLVTDADDPILGFAVEWLALLSKRVERIDVITVQRGRFDVPPNVRVFSVGKERGYGRPRRLANFYLTLLRLVISHRYDVCFAHMMPLFTLLGSPLLKLKKVPTVLWFTHTATSHILRLAEKQVDRIVTASEESFRLPSKKVMVVGHGIETRVFLPLPKSETEQETFTLATIGRISPVKRLETLIEAFALLLQEVGADAACLRITGPILEQDMEYGRRLRDLARDLGIEKWVEFVGPLTHSEVVGEFQRAHVFVNVSDGGLDKAVLEAMSCGVPVVTSNEACASLLAPIDRRLVIAKGNPYGLAQSCQYVLEMSNDERESLGRRLRTRVINDHGLDRLMDDLVAGFLEVSAP